MAPSTGSLATLTLLQEGAASAVEAAGGSGVYLPFLPGWILLLPLIGAVLNGGLALAVARRGTAGDGRPLAPSLPSWIGPGVVLAAFGVALVNFVRMSGVELHDPVVVRWWSWIATGELSLDAAVQLDQLSVVMTLIVTGVGFLIHLFSVGYMREDRAYARYFAYLNLFVFFMLVLVLGASYPVMFVGWEGVGLCSYLLIGFWFADREKSDAGKKAFIVNRIGDLGFLIAIFLLFTTFGTLDFVEIFEAAPTALAYGGATVTAITLFFLLGAAGKSAQIPLYVWLPDAMAGPTPVSALIHAATMVTAGVYLVARSSVLFALAPVGSAAVAGIGALTALLAATIALAQYDIKKVLAYSTISQLGYMFLGVGVGAYAAGIFHLMTHAFFKALLFLGSGAVIHAMHEALHHTHSHEDPQDMRNMGGLRKYMPVTFATMWIATLAISGIWPFAGFFSKDEIIWAAGAFAGAGDAPFPGLHTLLWVIALATALLTAFYMTRMMVMTFHGANRTGEGEREHLHEVGPVMTIPLVALALLSVFGGWVNVPEAVRSSFLGGFGALPMSEWLHHWLEPLTEAAHEIHLEHVGEVAHASPIGGGEVLWAALSTVAALVVVAGAVAAVRRWTILPAAEAGEPESGLRRILYRKWYVDEAYDRVVVRPVLALSRGFWKVVDEGIVDRSVNLMANVMKAWGVFGSLFQSGTVNVYAFVFTLGALILLGVAVL